MNIKIDSIEDRLYKEGIRKEHIKFFTKLIKGMTHID
jgi:hypothetical protein